MSFVLSKIAGALLAPMTLLLLALAASLLLLCLPRPRLRRLGRLLLGGLLAIALLLSWFPFERLYLGSLERRFPVPTLPARIDGIIVLGGGLEFGDPRGPRLNSFSLERAVAAARLAQQHPEARVVLSGGYGALPGEIVPTEASLMAELFQAFGIAPERLVVEASSRTTWENALRSHETVRPQPGETWVLVTSAAHMPRSVGAFRAAGWSVVAYPVGALATNRPWLALRFRPLQSINALSVAEHEWLGLLAYRLAGQSSAFFPSP